MNEQLQQTQSPRENIPVPEAGNPSKKWIFVLLGVVILAIIAGGGYYYKTITIRTSCPDKPIVCPDGTIVKRSPPECKFAECPAVKDETSGGKTNNSEEIAKKEDTGIGKSTLDLPLFSPGAYWRAFVEVNNEDNVGLYEILEVHVYDDRGLHTGPTQVEPGPEYHDVNVPITIVEEQIPNSRMDEVSDYWDIVIDSGVGGHTFEFVGRKNNYLWIRIGGPSGKDKTRAAVLIFPRDLCEKSLAELTEPDGFLNALIKISPNFRAKIELPATMYKIPVLSVDADGNGNYETELQPALVYADSDTPCSEFAQGGFITSGLKTRE